VSGSKLGIQMKDQNSIYNNHNELLKEGDIIEVIIDRAKGNLSFNVNDIDYGIACSSIPKEDVLYPIVIIYEPGINVEIV